MNIHHLLSHAKQLGIEIQVHNGKLFANGKLEVVNSILPQIKTYKSELLNHFNSINHLPTCMTPRNSNGSINLDMGSGYTDDDLFYDFSERASILQYEGSVDIYEAERLSYHETLVAHMRRDYHIILDDLQFIIDSTPADKRPPYMKT